MHSSYYVKLFIIVSSTLAIAAAVVAADNSETDSAIIKSGVYALPEIRIKLENGTNIQVEPDSPVILSQELAQVELSCTADYPVKWEYLVKNKTIPLLDIVYRRLIRNISDFDNPKRNRFMSIITLRGLHEYQTGKYLCRHYNERIENNNYAVASYFDVFIKGDKTFNTISNIQFWNKTTLHVDIHCPVSDPDLHVRLYKLNEKIYNITKGVVWKAIYANYEPTHGFRLFAGLGRELLGVYNCTADSGPSILSIAADLSEKEHYHATLTSTPANLCWENQTYVQYIRSKRLECYCKNSFGLFMNDNFEFENRQASCSIDAIQSKLQQCSDWRLVDFFENGEKSSDVCFREPIRADGSGSRPNIKVRGESFPDGDSKRDFPFTKLSVTYNGFVDWAGDFMLAICRKKVCQLSRNNSDSDMDLEFIQNEPTRTQYFPMAHQQAEWANLYVNGTDVKSVYVFQAHSLSYAWFPYAADIGWGKMENAEDTTTESQQMSSSSSSSGSIIKNYFHVIIFVALLCSSM